MKPEVFDLPDLPSSISLNRKWVRRVRRSVYIVGWKNWGFHCISCLKRSNKLVVSDLMIKRFFKKRVRKLGLTRLIVTIGVFDVERIKGKAGKAYFEKTSGFGFHEVFV